MKNFKEQNEEFQHLIREYLHLRTHNNNCAKNNKLDECLLFSEAGVLLMAFERFLRIVPAMKSKIKKGDTLSDLLNHAFAKKNPVFKKVHTAPIQDFKKNYQRY